MSFWGVEPQIVALLLDLKLLSNKDQSKVKVPNLEIFQNWSRSLAFIIRKVLVIGGRDERACCSTELKPGLNTVPDANVLGIHTSWVRGVHASIVNRSILGINSAGIETNIHR